MRYQLTIGGTATILDPTLPFVDAEGVHHPSNALSLWSDAELAAVGVTKIADAPPGVPAVVSRLQAKVALQNAALLTSAESAVAAAAPATQIYWSDAADFHRDNPILLGVAATLGLTSDQIDALFVAAAAIS